MEAHFVLALAVLAASALGAVPRDSTDQSVREAAAHVAALEARLSELQVSGHVSGRINPELSPVSDKKFFDGKRADYPTDGRPSTKDHFSFPFPIVQDSHDFDKDYVKDENADNGQWKAQAHYDELRSALSSVKDAADKAARKEAEEAEELKKAEEAEKKAAEEAAKEAKAAAEAKKQQEEAKKKSAAVNSTIVESEKLVKSEVTDLEDCKKQLEEAKAHLQKLMTDKEAAAKKQAELDAAAAAASKEEAEAKAVEISAHEEHDHAKAEHDGKVLSHAEKVAKMEKEVAETNSELEAAAKNLRKFRQDADGGKGKNGGVYYRNGGCRTGLTRAAAVMVIGLAVLRIA